MVTNNNQVQIEFVVNNKEVKLKIFGEDKSVNTLFEIENTDAIINGEAPIQLIEGHFYEYIISSDYYLKASEIINPSRINPSSGRIIPNIYVGTLTVDVIDVSTNKKCAELKLEIR